MALGRSLCLDASMALVAAKTTQINVALAAAWPLVTSIVSGGLPEPWDQHDLQWYQEPQTSTQVLAEVESWTPVALTQMTA